MNVGAKEGNPSSRRTSVGEAWVEADGTLVLRFDAECRLTESGTKEMADAHVELADGSARLVLADVRGLISADRGSRQIASGPNVTRATSRLAILVGNPVTRVLGNFFLKVSTPKYPTRIFNDETSARAWLRER